MSAFESIDPCTNDVIWRGAAGDVGAAVANARRALPDWAMASLDARIAVVRAFKTVVAARADDFARLIATETGKPLWETKTEVAAVAAKVDISITAQAERAGARSGEVAGTRSGEVVVRQALRHKPHGVLAVLGPYNFRRICPMAISFRRCSPATPLSSNHRN